jgi:hypothetical protein
MLVAQLPKGTLNLSVAELLDVALATEHIG